MYDCIFQLAQDIIFDLRQLLNEVRSTENQLKPPQNTLENTLQQALGKTSYFPVVSYFIFIILTFLYRSVRSRTIAAIELKSPVHPRTNETVKGEK